MTTLRQWIAARQKTVFSDTDDGFAQSATFWAPAQDPATDTGTAVTVTIADRGEEPQLDHYGASRRTAAALVDKTEITLTRGEPGFYGTIDDENAERWVITEIIGESTAYYKVRLARLEVDRSSPAIRAPTD